MVPFYVMLPFGIFCIVSGILTLMGNTLLIKKRHKRYVSEANFKKYCLLNGISLILLGPVMITIGLLISFFGENSAMMLIVFPMLLIATAPSLYATMKYNRR